MQCTPLTPRCPIRLLARWQFFWTGRRHAHGILICLLCVSTPMRSLAQSPDHEATALPRDVLSDQELDSITAAAARIDLDLSAFAQGPTAVTSTAGSVGTGRTTVLRITTDPQAPALAHMRLVGTSTADIVFAAGHAEAAGASDARCTANLTPNGNFAYLAQSKTVSNTATSAVCSCAAFGISLVSP